MATKKDLEAAADYFAESDKVTDETSGGDFFRLKDGEKKTVVFVKAKPLSFKQVWLNDQNRSEIFDESKHDGMRPSGRHLLSLVVIDEVKGIVPQVLEASNDVKDKVKKVVIKYGWDTSFEIEREGTGTDSVYTILFEAKLEEEQYEAVMGAEHASLEKVLEAKSSDTQSKGEPSRKEKKANPWEKK